MRVFKGLHSRFLSYTAEEKCVAHFRRVHTLHNPDGDLVDIAVVPADDAPELRIHHECTKRYFIDLRFKNAFYRNLARYVSHVHAYLRADTNVVERRKSWRVYRNVLIKKIVAEHYLVVIVRREEFSLNDVSGDAGYGILFTWINADDVRVRDVRLIRRFPRLIPRLETRCFSVPSSQPFDVGERNRDGNNVGTVLDVALVA